MRTALTVLAVSLLLAGCENLDTGRPDNVITASVARFTQPPSVVDYMRASTADFHVVDSALTQLKAGAIGQPEVVNGFIEADIRFTRGLQVWTSRAAQELRIALPGDAVKARHPDAIKALGSFARYVATRPDAAATRPYVAAPLVADRNWMAAQLRKAGTAGVIDEQQQSYTAVGWTMPGLAKDRTVVEKSS